MAFHVTAGIVSATDVKKSQSENAVRNLDVTTRAGSTCKENSGLIRNGERQTTRRRGNGNKKLPRLAAAAANINFFMVGTFLVEV